MRCTVKFLETCLVSGVVVQVLPWILDVGYTVLLVALLVAFMGHLLFGDFEYTMNTVSASITGLLSQLPRAWPCCEHSCSHARPEISQVTMRQTALTAM